MAAEPVEKKSAGETIPSGTLPYGQRMSLFYGYGTTISHADLVQVSFSLESGLILSGGMSLICVFALCSATKISHSTCGTNFIKGICFILL